MREREQLEAEDETQRSPEVEGDRQDSKMVMLEIQAAGSRQGSRAVMGNQSPEESGGLSQR